jgi:undecaprenyl-diphosphatase
LEALTNYKDISNGVGWPATIVATVASGVVAYGVIAWLLKFIAHHTYTIFITYRLVLGVVLIILLATHTLSAT